MTCWARNLFKSTLVMMLSQSLTANKRIKQHIMMIEEHRKEEALVKLLNSIHEYGPGANLIPSECKSTQKPEPRRPKISSKR